MSEINKKLMDLMSELKGTMEDYKDSLKLIEINERFSEIIIETINRTKWYKEGKCYHCGGSVRYDNDKSLFSDVRCKNCGKNLYTDALAYYYYNPIIKKILELAKDLELE